MIAVTTTFNTSAQKRIAEREMYTHSYPHRGSDPDNCAACALAPSILNYSGWSLMYIAAGRKLPKKAFLADLAEAAEGNTAYFANVARHLQEYGFPGWDTTTKTRQTA